MPDIEGVPYEAGGSKLDLATAKALAARHREASSAGVTAAGETVGPVRSQVSALSARVDKTLTDAKAYTDAKVTGLATTAAMRAGDQKSLTDAKRYADSIAWQKGALETRNLDGVVEPGTYWQSTAANATVARGYPRGGMLCVLEVQRAASSIVTQTLTHYDSTGVQAVYRRTVYTGGKVTEWVQVFGGAEIQRDPVTGDYYAVED